MTKATETTEETTGETRGTVEVLPVVPAGDGIPRSPGMAVAVPRLAVANKHPSGEPDHSGVAKAREDRETHATAATEGRKERRQRVRSGTLSGKWVPFGGSLVNMDAVSVIDLPTEGNPERTLTVTLFSGKVVSVSGEEAAEIMDELQLTPLPKKEGAAGVMVMREDGRIMTLADHNSDPGRIAGTPNHPHRANAILENAETDRDVTNRAGSAVVPPARDLVPAGEPPEPGNGEDAEPGAVPAAEHRTRAKGRRNR